MTNKQSLILNSSLGTSISMQEKNSIQLPVNFKDLVNKQTQIYVLRLRQIYMVKLQADREKNNTQQSQSFIKELAQREFDCQKIYKRIKNVVLDECFPSQTPKRNKRRAGNPQMQKILVKWMVHKYIQGYSLTHYQIKCKARTFSEDKYFKASKGWLQKFYQRFPQLKLIGQIMRKAPKKNILPEQEQFYINQSLQPLQSQENEQEKILIQENK